MVGIVKSYGGVRALRGATLKGSFGEVHGLVGENGAGKSTLVKVLSGAVAPDDGTVTLNGHQLQLGSPRDAVAAGIGTVFQELSLIPDLSIAANLFYGREPQVRWGRVNQRALLGSATRALDGYGLHFGDLRRPVRSLRLSERQVLEIVKTLMWKPSVLLLDEATSALLPQQVDWLFAAVRKFAGDGGLVLFISHRMAEVETLCDRITVFRNGLDVGSRTAEEMDEAQLVEMMLGRSVQRVYPPRQAPVGEAVVCRAKGLSSPPALHGVDLEVRAGEIVGVAGLDGQGQAELFLALFGARASRGDVELEGGALHVSSPARALRSGVGLVPEDRARDGLCLSMTIRDNLVMSSLAEVSGAGFLRRSRMRDLVEGAQRRLKIKYADRRQPVAALSGGNQQKVLLGRVLACSPRLLLMFDATRGVDIGTKSEIYSLMRAECDNGVGILFYSSDVAELVNMADQIIVLHDGTVHRKLQAPMTEEQVVAAVVGAGGPAVPSPT
jgi:ribose transport system ATP-binding protein